MYYKIKCKLKFDKRFTFKLKHGEFKFKTIYIYIYIYAFSWRFYPKRLTLHSSYSFIFYLILI